MARGKGQPYGTTTDAQSRTPSAQPIRIPPSGPLANGWVPRQFLTSTGVKLTEFRQHLNARVRERGMILADGQILTSSMPEDAQVVFDGDHAWELPPLREWSALHQQYFGLNNPYQPAEDGDVFTSSHVMWRVRDPYVTGDERIVAVLHGETEDHLFSCLCHFAQVVYTTRHRLVCMSCGFLHAVLLVPLQFHRQAALSAEDWCDFFDDDGPRRDEPVALSVLDFRDVEHAPMLWETEHWLGAKHEFIFFARSSQDVIWEAIRGTERDPSIFAEAGWTPVPMGPAPAEQLSDTVMDVDLLQNAALAFAEGTSCYATARTQPEQLVHAILQLFRALELLLKTKLQDLNPTALDDRPRVATVIKRLGAAGTTVSPNDRATIDRARKLRNHLQHGTATFNQRDGLRVCRNVIIFIDRFAKAELDLWIGDITPTNAWKELVKIEEVKQTAMSATEAILGRARTDARAEITSCEYCGQDTMFRPDPRTGASCVFCHHIPTSADGEIDM